jgi:glucokinase
MTRFVVGADVGATKTLLALAECVGDAVEIVFDARYEDADYAHFDDLVRAFVAEARVPAVDAAALGIAGPVTGERVRVTNRDWVIDAREVGARLGTPRVALLNDFAAAARGIDLIGADERIVIQAGEPVAGAPQLVIGAGTGLGVAFRIAGARGYDVIAGEGGHIGFAPADAEQCALHAWLRPSCGRVIAEHVLSGIGLARIDAFLRGEPSASPTLRAPAAVTEAATAGNDPKAKHALDLFLRCYGAVVGDYALAVLARGGVYIAGGIAAKVAPQLAASDFRQAFNAKGPHAALAARFPITVVTNERLGLLGALAAAARLAS